MYVCQVVFVAIKIKLIKSINKKKSLMQKETSIWQLCVQKQVLGDVNSVTSYH